MSLALANSTSSKLICSKPFTTRLPDRDDFLYTACYIGIPYFKYVVWYLLGKEEESTKEQEVNEVV